MLSTYWSPAQLQGLEKSLLEQRRALSQEQDAAQHTRDGELEQRSDDAGSSDTKDLARRKEQIEEINANLRRLGSELMDVEQALNRMQRGVFGVCIGCGNDIPAARLRAQPSAARCLSCQQSYESAISRISRGSSS